MKLTRHVLLLCLVFVFTGIVSAQDDVDTLVFDQDTLINFTTNQPTTVFDFMTESPTTLVLTSRYLGTMFPFQVEVFDDASTSVAMITIEDATEYSLNIPSEGNYTIIFYIQEGNGGRAVINASVASLPQDGIWQMTYVSEENSCPDILTLDAVWLPMNASEVELAFSDPIVPLDFHMAVAPLEIAETPEFFETSILEDGSYLVIPGIQGAPYLYTYTILNDETVQLAYLETLSMTDCELSIVAELAFVAEEIEEETTDLLPSVDVSGWSVVGDADTPVISDNVICASDMRQGATWYFDAPPTFVDQVVNGYGQILSFELNQDVTTSPFDDIDIVLVVGNGILLGYDLLESLGSEFTPYTVSLTEDAGWYDVDGMFTEIDADLFQQMLLDVTRVQIRGEFSEDIDTGCLRNPMVSGASASAGGSSNASDDMSTSNNTQSNEPQPSDTESIDSGQIIIDGQALQVGDWLATGTLGGVGCEGQEIWDVSAALEARTLNLTIQSDGIVDNSMTNPLLYIPTDIPNQFLHDNTTSSTVAFRFYLDFTSATTGTYRQYFITGSSCSGAFTFDLEFQG